MATENMPGEIWVSDVLSRLPGNAEFVSLSGNNLTVRLKENLSVAETGALLEELEQRLRWDVHPQIEVILETTVDGRSRRMRYRGIEMGWQARYK